MQIKSWQIALIGPTIFIFYLGKTIIADSLDCHTECALSFAMTAFFIFPVIFLPALLTLAPALMLHDKNEKNRRHGAYVSIVIGLCVIFFNYLFLKNINNTFLNFIILTLIPTISLVSAGIYYFNVESKR